MSDAPVPAPPAPPREGARPVGCLPILVFVLTVATAAGIVALRCELLPTEKAGRVVIEVLDKPSKDDMKAHAARIRSGAVLERAANDLGGKPPRNVREDIRDRLQQSLHVTVRGPFLTVTVFEKNWSPAEVANTVAETYNHDLNLQADDVEKRQQQNLIGQITLQEASTEKARLEWLDITKNHGFTPGGTSPVDEDAIREISARLAKARPDLALAERRAAAMADQDFEKALTAASALPGDTGRDMRDHLRDYFSYKAAAALPEAPPAAAGDLKAARDNAAADLAYHLAQIQGDTKQLQLVVGILEESLKQHENSLTHREARRSDMDEAKHRYESQVRLIHNLREENMHRQVRNGVVRRPTRIVEEARTIQVPDHRTENRVRLGTAACALLLAAFVLSAFVSRLVRRA